MLRIFLFFFFSSILTLANAQDTENDIDVLRDEFNSEVNRLSTELDRFLSGEKFEHENAGSRIDLQSTVRVSNRAKPVYQLHYGLNLGLPRTTKRLNFLVQSSEDRARNWISQKAIAEGASTPEDSVKDGPQVGLRYRAHNSSEKSFKIDGGVKAKWKPEPFASERARKSFLFGHNELRLTQQIQWQEFHGWQTDLNLDFDRQLTDRLIFSVTNRGHRTSKSILWEVENALNLAQKLTPTIGGSITAGVTNASQPVYHLTSYFVSTTIGWRFFESWILAELTPAVSWPNAQHFRPDSNITFNLEFELVD